MAEKMETKNQDLSKFKTDLQRNLEKQLIKGDTWYLIDNHWLKQVKKYVGFENTMYDSGGTEAGDENNNPGPIDNKTLFKDDESGEIREHMIDELDYVLVPEEGWNMLVKKFGLVEGQEAIARKVVDHGMFVKHCKVEVYYIEFQLVENSDLETVVKKKFSKSDTLEHIGKLMRTKFNINEGVETRLWNKYTSNTYEQLARLDNTVEDAGLFSGQLIIIEQKNEDGTWPRQARSTNSMGTFSSGLEATSPIPAPPASAGSIQLDKKEDSPGDGTFSGTAISTSKGKYDTEEGEKQFVENMKSLYGLKSFSDLVIFCGDQKFPCHKNVLAARSDVFKEMLENEENKINGELEITETDPDVFKHLVDHVYTGKIPNDIDNVVNDLYKLAIKYNLQILSKACEISLLDQITEENALDTLVTMDHNTFATSAKNDVMKYITINGKEIIETEKFKTFSKEHPELMIEIVRCLLNP